MAHLSIEYSKNLEDQVDMAAFCEVARQAMVATRTFPLAGIRVRAFCAEHVAIGDGGRDLAFADMILRMGQGRDVATRKAAQSEIYAALESWCDNRVTIPFALSLEVQEISAEFSQKRLNTIRPALLERGNTDV